MAGLRDRLRRIEVNRGYNLLDHEPEARAVLEAAVTHGLDAVADRARLALADIDAGRGDVERAAASVAEIARRVVDGPDREVEARLEFLLYLLHLHAGDMVESRLHALRSVSLLPAGAPPGLRAEHLLAVSVTIDNDDALHSVDEVLEEVLEIAATSDQPWFELFALNNFAWLRAVTGRLPEAMEAVARMRAFAVRRELPLRSADLDTIATAEWLSGDPAAAWETIQLALAPDVAGQVQADHEVVARLTAARILLALDRNAEAGTQIDVARGLATTRGLREMLAECLEMEAAHLAAIGDWAAAYDAHRRFHAAHLELASKRGAMRAMLAQAQYDAVQARRSRDHFRELAMTDALTGLPNRRAAEARVVAALRDTAHRDAPVALAIIDCDHFKRINDTRSHETGDRVLERLGELLAEHAGAAPGRFCARLGGEEFLALWCGWDEAAVAADAEGLRRAVAERGWDDVTDALPVTVSVGVTTTATTPGSWSALLSAADQHLYAAKHGGRDCVVGPA